MLRALKNKLLIPVFVFTFITTFSSGMVSAVNVLFALDLGATYIDLGLISFFTGFFTMCLQIPLGILSDRIGRKRILFLPVVFAMSSDVIRIFAAEPWHLIVAGFFGVVNYEIIPVIIALVADLATPSDMPDSMSMHYFFSSLGAFIGPGVSSLLLLFLPIRSLYYIDLVTGLGMLVLIALGIKEVKKASQQSASSKTNYKGNVARLLKKTNMFLALQARLSYTFCQTSFVTYAPVLARQQLRLPDALIASLGTFQGFGRLGIRLFLGRLIRKMTTKRLFVLALLMSGASGLMFFANNFYYLVLFASLVGLVEGINAPITSLLASDVSTVSERGFANSTVYTASMVGQVTPIMVAPVAEGFGVPFVFPFASVLPIASALTTAWFMKPLSTEK